MAVKTPAPQRAAGRRKLAAKGQALPDDSFPIPNVSYLHKAIQAVGRAAPGKRPALGRLIRKRARQLGAWSAVKGSWADNTQSAKAMSSALRATLELAASNGDFVWELASMPAAGEMDRIYKAAYASAKGKGQDPADCVKYAMSACKAYAKRKGYPPSAVKKPAEYAGVRGEPLDFVGPEGYSHGWVYHGGPGLPKIAPGTKVRFPQSSGTHEGKVTEVSGQHLHVHVTKGEKAGQDVRIHSGLVTHTYSGGGTKTPAVTGAAHSATDMKAARAKYSGPALTPTQKIDRTALPKNGKAVYDSSRKRGDLHVEAMSHAAEYSWRPRNGDFKAPAGGDFAKYQSLRSSGMSHGGAVDRMAAEDKYRVSPADAKKFGISPETAESNKRSAAYRSARADGLGHVAAVKKSIAKVPDSHGNAGTPEKETPAGSAVKAATAKPKVNAPKQPSSQTVTPGGNKATVATPEATTKTPIGMEQHSVLLKARTDMRAKYPPGHPERLKAERAVRQSRKTRRAGEGGSSAGATTRTAVAGTSRRRTKAPSKFNTPVGRTGSTDTTSSVADHQAEYGALKPFQKRAYDKAKLQGIGHQRSMSVAKSAPTPPKGTEGRAVRKAENKAAKASGVTMTKAQERATRPHNKAQLAAAAVAKGPEASPADVRLAARLGITVEKVQQMRSLAAALERRGWSQSEARKLAAGRIVHGRPIPQLAPGKKIARSNRT